MRVLEFALASLFIELTPGPNMGYLATLAMAKGWPAAVKAVAGVALGIGIVGLVTAFGLAEFLNRYPVIEGMLRWGGVLFMAGLAIEAWYKAGRERPGSNAIEFASFWRGLITNILNPKLIIFFVAVLPDFMDKKAGKLLLQNLTLVVVYTTMATLVHLSIIATANQARRAVFITANQKTFGRLMAVLLLAVAVWLWGDMQL